ncbi:MAG: glutathione S-transferase N-terminal domain-containing protein [Xanthomonadales bacterium]|nr:glutathione S-transferase N-terminal domain-containing protein [Xanthomonadales bacterium]
MSTSRNLNSLFLISAPLLVVLVKLSLAATCGLIAFLLLWRWLLILASMSRPPAGPELILDTISASHYVEKVRWCMDRLGVDYQERPSGGTLGAFFLGRTVPRLRFRSGMVESSIGNSAEILRYLWGRYQVPMDQAAEFLRADPQRLELEQQIDRVGRDLQVWVYYHLLPYRSLTLQAWGANNPAVAIWQRWALRLLFPVLRWLIRRAFSINTARYQKALQHVNELLAHTEALLADQRQSLLGGNELNYTDFSFAAINGLWLAPKHYGRGQANAVRLPAGHVPAAMLSDVDNWNTRYPLSSGFITKLYQRERLLQTLPHSTPAN